jgi:hypothetical protein
MSKTKGKLDGAFMIAGERLVGGIAIHLQNAG